MDIEQFNPTVAELNKLVLRSSEIKEIDLDDKSQIEMVKGFRIELRDARVAITKKGKELREEALAFQRSVISKEKELVAIIEPEEDRLSTIEEQAQVQKEKKERLALLPDRKEKLSSIGDCVEASDDEILAMDANRFGAYMNQRIMDKNTRDREEIEARENAVREAEEKARKEAEAKENEERIRNEEREKVEREQKMKEIRDMEEAARKKIEEERALEAEKARVKSEAEALEKEKDYQKFLKSNGYSDETKSDFSIIKSGSEVRLYKLVGTYNQK